MTKTEKLIIGAEKLGWKKVESKSGKYKTFEKDGYNKLFIGRKGAIRYGKNSSSSRNVAPTFEEILLNSFDS